MSNRWTNTTRFPLVDATQISDDDLLMLALDAAAEGSKQRIVTVAALRAAIAGSTTIIPVTANYTPEPADSGAQHRVTAEAEITLAVNDPIGTYYVIANQAGAAPVTLAAGVSATLTTAGDATQVAARGTVVAVKVDSTGWEAYGAFIGDGPSPNVSIREITTNDTPTDADSGKRLNVTSQADISLDDDREDGTWFVVRAETADPVALDVIGTATMSPDGPLVLVPFTAALCTHITGGAWQVEGAFEAGS